jgi:hypothetical protein
VAVAQVTRNEQFKLHAYVCGNACLQTPDVDGTMSFQMVFLKRPENCRYAIVTHYNIEQHGDEVLVWDLYEAMENLRTGAIVPPEPVRKCESVDAAIMATFMLYEDS